MTEGDIRELFEASDSMCEHVPTSFHRYMASKVDWRDRLICIKGASGVGKTTLMLQHMRETFGVRSDKAVYASLDDLYFATHRLRDVAYYLVSHGFTHLFLDEVHHLKDWQLMVKNINDQLPELNICYSGSSLLAIERAEGDLTRRQAAYALSGMSFREYLEFEGVLDVPPIAWMDLLEDHVEIAHEIASKIKVLPLFEKYLRQGFYPFYRSSYAKYHERIVAMVGKVLDVDYPKVEEVSSATIAKAKKMLMVLSNSTPQQPNMSRLYAELETTRNNGLKMLDALARSGLLSLVVSQKSTLKNLSSPEKIYCDNPNLMHALVREPDVGTLRECFFMNQVSHEHQVSYPVQGDFLVDGTDLFEVGGAGKGFEQVAGIPHSHLAVDDTEVGRGERIPLWLFGFLY